MWVHDHTDVYLEPQVGKFERHLRGRITPSKRKLLGRGKEQPGSAVCMLPLQMAWHKKPWYPEPHIVGQSHALLGRACWRLAHYVGAGSDPSRCRPRGVASSQPTQFHGDNEVDASRPVDCITG